MTENNSDLKHALAKTQRDLAASRARFRNIIEKNADGILVVDLDGVIRFANPAAAHIFDRPAQTLLGADFGFPIVFEDRAEISLICKPLETVTAEMRVTESRWGDEPCYLVSLRDITERKMFERDRQKVAHLNQLLLDSLPHPAMLIRRDRQILAANRAAIDVGAEVGGYCWREFAGSQYIPAEAQAYMEESEGELPADLDVKCTFCLADEALAREGPTNLPELEAFDKLWDTWWVPIDDSTYLHYAIDITERRQMERKIRESEQRLDGMLQTMVDGIVFVNTAGEITYANAAAEEILGIYRDEILGRHYNEPSWCRIDEHGRPFPLDQLPLAIALRERRAVEGIEHAIVVPDGQTKWLSVNAAPMLDNEGHLDGAVASFRDITARKAIEDRVKRYATELKQSNENLEQFAYAISHDLQEPVRMVKSYLELLERHYQDALDAKSAQYIDYAVDGATRMQEMIQALLSLSRVESRGQAFAPTDVEAVLQRTLMALGRIIHESGAEITYDPLPTVMADRIQLSQVFQNLIANAIKFHRANVPPHVHISATTAPPTGETEGGPIHATWIFSVTDNGIGIDPDQIDRIFHVFQRLHTEDEYPGLGMGLALCQRIIARHGGRIWAQSQPGEGTTFYFTIPQQEDVP
jgi:PAS domain S-box-containing protein